MPGEPIALDAAVERIADPLAHDPVREQRVAALYAFITQQPPLARAVAALPGRTQLPRNRPGARHQPNQCRHETQPPENPHARRTLTHTDPQPEHAMELDDITAAWRSLEQRLDQQTALTSQLLGDMRSHAARAQLRLLWLSQSVQLLCAITLNRRHRPQLAPVCRSGDSRRRRGAAAAVVRCAGSFGGPATVAVVATGFRQATVTDTARACTAAALAHTRGAVAGRSVWVLWVAVADAAWRTLTGLSLPNAWLLCNVVVGAPGGIGTWLGDRRLQRRGPPWLERLDTAHAGRSVARTETLLEQIARFQRE